MSSIWRINKLKHIYIGVQTSIVFCLMQIAISASNTGGAWDNAKKYIEVKVSIKFFTFSALLIPVKLKRGIY